MQLWYHNGRRRRCDVVGRSGHRSLVKPTILVCVYILSARAHLIFTLKTCTTEWSVTTASGIHEVDMGRVETSIADYSVHNKEHNIIRPAKV